MARIILINEADKPSYELSDQALTIGRLPDNRLVLADSLVSRAHAEIVKDGDVYRMLDKGSLNGVYVNNLRINNERLTHGDVIVIGETRMLFEDRIPASDGGAAPSGDVPEAPQTPSPAPGGEASPGLGGPEIIKPLSEAEDLDIMSLDEALGPDDSRTPPERANTARSRNFFILYQVARALNSTSSLSELLDQTMSLIFQVIAAERGVIFLLNKKGQLEPTISRSRSGGELPEMTVSQTITQRAIDEKAAIITADAVYDPRFTSGVSIVAYNIRSAICVPLWERGRIRGAIYLDNLVETYAFGEDDLDLLTAIANQVAIAVQHEEMQSRMREIAVVRANLERFHSPDVANYILQQSRLEDGIQRLLEVREVTVLFCDICDFTPLMEKMDAEAAAELLVDFFDEMTEIIFKYKGTVDKFIGDALMAIFGAPISHGNDAELAIYSAIDMMKRLEEWKSALDEKQRFDVRIGINTGMVVSGYLGSRRRTEYSVLGDPVNVAARLQDHAAPGTILIGEDTYNKVHGVFKVKDRGTTRLKGKSRKTQFYEVVLD